MSAKWIEQWDRFTCNDPDHVMHGHTAEVVARKMHGYLVSSVTGPRWVRMFIQAGDMPGARWIAASVPTDMDEAVRLSVLNVIAENDSDDVDAGTPLSVIVDTIEARSGKHPSLAYVTALLASIGATERDGLWSVASLPAGWRWERTTDDSAVRLTHGERGNIALAGVSGAWIVHGWNQAPGSGHAASIDAAIERATWECRRRGLFAPVAGGAP